MSQSFEEVQAALDGVVKEYLTSVGLDLPIVDENKRYVPSLSQDYIRTTLIPTQTTKESLGLGGYNRLNGLFQIDLFYAAGRTPIKDINRRADEMLNFITNKMVISEGNSNTRIEEVWRDVSITESDWFQLPVQVRWESYQNR